MMEMDEPTTEIIKPEGFCHSDQIDKLLGAISKAQAKFPSIKKSESVDFTHNGKRTNYSYADLAKFVAAIRPHLAENGLGVMHDCKTIPAGCSASTFIGHSSGQWMKSGAIIVRPSDTKPQTIGSALTYARRYSLTSFLSLCSEDEDDDAAAASGIEPAEREPFGTPDHMALAAAIMTKYEVHQKDRQSVINWLVESKQSSDPSVLDLTIKRAAMAIKVTAAKEASKDDGPE